MDAQRGIARRMVIGLPPEGLSPAWERDFAAYPPAGVILFARDFRDLDGLRRLTSRLRELSRPRRIFIAADEEGGFVSQLAPHLVVPPAAALLARGAAPGEIEWVHRVTGARLSALGLDWAFAPVADIHSAPSNPVIGPRAFGTTPEAVAERVGQALRGLASGGVASCLKHFPGHGDTALDSHLALPSSAADRDLLERRELAPFRAHLEADAVMTAHVVYPALDPGRPATFSRAIVHDLLRERLGFEGVCITDALEMKGAAAGREPLEVARLALEAGCDLLLFAFHDEAVRRARLELARALVEGGLDRAGFDAARPRLERLDRAHPEPDAATLAAPLESLTPPDWERKLEAIAARGLVLRGTPPAGAAGGPWRVTEPAFPYGPTLASALAAEGVPLAAGGGDGAEIVAVASRTPLAAEEIGRLRARSRERPVVLVALQGDAFLDAVPEAALRVSACDPTPLTRRVVARAIAARLREAAAARA
ncbi:MAG TPA: glycoside hydrolase family 3 N-terminal domain-containing protein [Candidatus Eisenbacteria bacterium]|jgi:beta-N-acetylhexosaminidase